MKSLNLVIILLLVCTFGLTAFSADQEVGREAAGEYFKGRKSQPKKIFRKPDSTGARYMSLHVGGFVDGETYKWGRDSGNVGRSLFGVSYRVGEWTNSMDLLFRGEVITYRLQEGKPIKLSLGPMIAFPDAKSGFPLYFGAGVGLGIFTKQIKDEGDLSFDYQVIAGARFFDIIGSTGLVFEAGLKNHVHLLSDGQYNGTFVAMGVVYTF